MTTIATSLTMPYKFTKQSNHHPLHRPTGMQKPRISNMCRMDPGLEPAITTDAAAKPSPYAKLATNH